MFCVDGKLLEAVQQSACRTAEYRANELGKKFLSRERQTRDKILPEQKDFVIAMFYFFPNCGSMNSIPEVLRSTVEKKLLLPSSRDNILQVYEPDKTPAWALAAIDELIAAENWTELNDRFFAKMKFGTGGIRGRTIGKTITKAEQGTPNAMGCPQYAAVGTNMMNDTNVQLAAQGLGEYLLKTFPGKLCKVAIAHDTRHFSRHFAELTARSLQSQGIDALLFTEERPTPQLSFSVRHFGAQAGVVITASHNPAHDNGFKCYFGDGGQVLDPHASGVIQEVERLAAGDIPTKATKPGTLALLDEKADQAYIGALRELVIEPDTIAKAKNSLKIVYSPLHGTGAKIIPQLLRGFGFNVSLVEAQSKSDGRFPTVRSPNPEYAEALAMGIEQAKNEGADLVIGTDPDDDRMGVAIRNAAGEFEIITGNMIGSIMAYYRTDRFFARNVLTKKNRTRAALIKTFVTTDLQKAIAQHFGVKCIDTLTGFKYIGAKLLQYEKGCGLKNYDAQPLSARRTAQLNRGTFFIFGGEESYGYSGGDYVRDKDANAATLMFAEAAAWAKLQGKTLLEYLDDIYLLLGFYTEKLGTLTLEGAAGAAQIQHLLRSYRDNPPKKFMGHAVTETQDFQKQTYKDADGTEIPKETMFMFHLNNGSRLAVRGSGTEPKIKYYFFTQAPAQKALGTVKKECRTFLEQWWDEVQADAKKRIAER